MLAGIAAVPAVLRLALRLARQSKEFDLIYANSQKGFVVGALASIIAGRPLVWHLHDLLTDQHFSASRRRLVTALANQRAARVLCNSAATQAAFCESGGAEQLTRVIPNGFDVDPFDAVNSAATERIRRTLSPDGAPLVGVFSRLAPWKGQHVLLDAMADLPDVRAVLVGGALFGEEAYEQALRVRAEALGIAERVTFTGFRDDIPALMSACDVVAHTSTSAEPFGRVIVEAMLAGRPVIATRAGGAQEIIEEGRIGTLVEPGDPTALAAALRDLVARPERTLQLAALGRLFARERFSLEHVVQFTEEELAAI